MARGHDIGDGGDDVGEGVVAVGVVDEDLGWGGWCCDAFEAAWRGAEGGYGGFQVFGWAVQGVGAGDGGEDVEGVVVADEGAASCDCAPGAGEGEVHAFHGLGVDGAGAGGSFAGASGVACVR